MDSTSMLLAILLILMGIGLIVAIPLLGWIPGIVLILIGVIVGILALVGRGVGALASIGTTKRCPDCRSKIPVDANVCRHCGFRFGGPAR
jgi:hypothetical protein